jgi:hypothetical protein
LEFFSKWFDFVLGHTFPFKNICYLLFDWFSNSFSTQMRYAREETRKFWEIGYRLLRGKFIRFLSGLCNSGHLVDELKDRGCCMPSESKINFAIPSLQTLTKEKLKPVHPGLLGNAIDSLVKNLKTKDIKISVDGKKIARGKGPVRIRVRIDPPHPLVCRKRRLNGAVLRMRPEKPRSRVTQVWHDKDPSLLKGPECRA